jgi:hypothetical protein
MSGYSMCSGGFNKYLTPKTLSLSGDSVVTRLLSASRSGKDRKPQKTTAEGVPFLIVCAMEQ